MNFFDLFTTNHRMRLEQLAKQYSLAEEERARLCPKDQCDILRAGDF